MGYGSYHPWPRRFGGNPHSGKPLTQVIHESLNAQRGPAYDTDTSTSIVRLENLAHARAIALDGWGTNERVSVQWDPRRTTDMLPRWERIFVIRPAPDATERARRDELTLRWQRFGGVTNHARMVTALTAALGDFLVGVEYISLANAVVHSPDASYPWGTQVDGVPWYSTVAHYLVRLQKPAGASEGDFYEAAGRVPTILDPIVSAFCTFDWYRAGSASTAVSGGPSAAGFYLDDDHNLNNEVFETPLIPTVALVDPVSGPDTGGGPAVTITGTNLDGVQSLLFGASEQVAQITSNTPTSIVLDSPVNPGGGLVDITVITADGSVVAANAYTFT